MYCRSWHKKSSFSMPHGPTNEQMRCQSGQCHVTIAQFPQRPTMWPYSRSLTRSSNCTGPLLTSSVSSTSNAYTTIAVPSSPSVYSDSVPATAEMLSWPSATIIARLAPAVGWALGILSFRFALPRVSDFRQIELDQWGHLWGLPSRLLRFLWPGEGQVPDLSGCLRLFQHLKGLQEHVPLPLAVMNLPDWPSEGVFNGGASRDSDGAVKFRCRRQNHGRKPHLLQEPRCQSNGLATERSCGGEKHGLHPFPSH